MPMKVKDVAKSVGRPRMFDETLVLDQAMYVFWEKGYEGSSLIDLTKAMGINRATMYGVFGNKQLLFFKALKRYISLRVTPHKDAMKEPTAYKVAERYLSQTAVFLTRPGYPHGCMTVQSALPATEEGSEIREELIRVRVGSQKALQQRFARAKREGDLPRSANVESLARFITAIDQSMTIQGINGATREELLDLAQTSLRAWPTA